MKNGRIGYFGGTFDPPHLGHVILAMEAYYQLKLDSLQWVVTPDPPHKKNRSITPLKKRLEMLELVMKKYQEFGISQVDLQRDPPHYAADTVEILKKDAPEGGLVYIIGEDSLRDLPDWKDPERFLANIDELAIAPRPNVDTNLEELDRELPGLMKKIVFISEIMLEISSSTIRDRIIHGAPYQHFLMTEIAEYIKTNQIY